jgi:hypothetical protein
MRLQGEQAQLRRYVDAYVRRSHSVGVHVGKILDGKYRLFGRRGQVFHIRHLSQFAWQLFSYQICVQQGFGISERLQRLQVSF